MHYWQMMPGDVFDETYVANFIMKAQQEDPTLARTLARRQDDIRCKFATDPQTHDVNVVIHLER